MPEYNVYANAPARLVKTVDARTPDAAIRKAKADISGWFIADDDGISLSDMTNHTVEESSIPTRYIHI